jgi:hypothetical protein
MKRALKKKKEAQPAAPSPAAPPAVLPVLPAGLAIPLPATVTGTLDRVAATQRRVHFLECGALLLALVPGLWLVQAAADWFFNLPWLVRFILLLVDIILVAYVVKRYAVEPWRKRLTRETAALRIEKEIPEFRSGLISAVQLASGRPGSTQGSVELVELLVGRVTGQLQRLEVAKRVVKTTRLKKWAKWMAGALAATLLAGFLAGEKTPVLMQRILLATVPLPTRTLVVPISKEGSVSIGSDMELSARAEGVVPKNGRVQIIYADGERQDISVSGTVDDAGVFSVTLRNIQQPFRYRFILNDGTGPEFEVAAHTPPVLASFRCVQTYPGYTQMGESEMAAGNLVFLAGSRIRIEGQSTQSLQSAKIRLEGVNQEIDMKIGGGDGKSVQGGFQVPKEGLAGFSLILINKEGVASLENTFYRVEFMADAVPVVELGLPVGDRLSVLQRTKPQLRYIVKDDFGIQKVVLKYELSRPAPPGGEEPAVESGGIALPLPSSASSGAPQTYMWDLSAVKSAWPEGSNVRYWIEVTDNNTVTGPGIGTSAPKSLVIVSEEAKKAELLEKLGSIANEIENVYNTQKKVNETLDSTIRKNQP